MSNSSLVSITDISPNKTSPRNHVIDTITIHCVVGQLSAKKILSLFESSSKQASCNYCIGTDGEIGLCVEESDRSWCSSNKANDHRAITIECASDTEDPYAINDAVYSSLINLCADICQRNGISELKWKADKSLIGEVDQQNMTVHRWFANKACPGDYIYNRLGQIAEEVNAKINSTSSSSTTTTSTSESTTSTTISDPFKVKVTSAKLRIRKGPGTNYSWTGKYTGAGTFTITEVSEGEGSDSGWGKLKSGAGWISLDYATIL